MPSVYAHYIFGKKVYASLPREEKRVIRKGKDAFLLGLHGPDLLFYYYPVSKNRINQQGVRMHKETAAVFFDKGRACYQEGREPALRAYLYGFLCHFILDSECHPYISRYMEEHGLGHLAIETEFDRYLMEKNGFDPLRYVPVHHLISRRRTRRQISRLFDRVSPAQIAVCIRLFRLTVAAFICRMPVKRMLLRAISRLAGQDKSLGGLVMDGRARQDCQESDRYLEARLKGVVLSAVEEICKYSRLLDSEGTMSVRLYQDFN